MGGSACIASGRQNITARQRILVRMVLSYGICGRRAVLSAWTESGEQQGGGNADESGELEGEAEAECGLEESGCRGDDAEEDAASVESGGEGAGASRGDRR